MLAILSSLYAHNFPIFQQILMILVSKVMVHRALSDKRYLSLGLLSPLITHTWIGFGILIIIIMTLDCGTLTKHRAILFEKLGVAFMQ